jgi:hypothetical protein
MNGVALHAPRYVLGDLLLTLLRRHPAVATLIAAGAYVTAVPWFAGDLSGLLGVTAGYLLGTVAAAAGPQAGFPGAGLTGRRPRRDR